MGELKPHCNFLRTLFLQELPVSGVEGGNGQSHAVDRVWLWVLPGHERCRLVVALAHADDTVFHADPEGVGPVAV